MPPDAFELRPATRRDFEFLWSLKQKTLRPYIEKTWGPWDDRDQRNFFSSQFSPAKVQIALVAGREAGMIEVSRKKTGIDLANIAILPEFQKRGLGSALIGALQAEARTAGVPLRLQVLKANPSARQLYLRLGFLPTGETETHHLLSWSRH